MLKRKPGPPPQEAGTRWIVELNNGQVHRVGSGGSGHFLVLGIPESHYVNPSDIIWHMPYEPMSEPMPEPLKPFRRFSCRCGDRRGMGAYNPNEGSVNRYRIHWNTGAVRYYRNEKQLEIDGIKIEWIDDD